MNKRPSAEPEILDEQQVFHYVLTGQWSRTNMGSQMNKFSQINKRVSNEQEFLSCTIKGLTWTRSLRKNQKLSVEGNVQFNQHAPERQDVPSGTEIKDLR